MLLDTPLDVALGLIFTYLLLSLIVSAAQEMLASWTNMRSKQLYDGLWRLLNNAPDGRRAPVPGPSAPTQQPGPGDAGEFLHKIWNHGLIGGLGQSGRGPSYISAKTFGNAVVDVLGNGVQTPTMAAILQTIQSLPNSPGKNALAALANRAGANVDAFHVAVSTWFDEAMDRVSGTYKRLAQKIGFALGLLFVVALNVNTFQVALTLWEDPSARHFVTDEAQKAVASQAAPDPHAQPADLKLAEARLIDTQTDLVVLPIGWQGGVRHVLYGADRTTQDADDGPWPHHIADVEHLLAVLIGWLMTALAVSLGAPFWFDTLQRFMNLRLSGPQPSSSTQPD